MRSGLAETWRGGVERVPSRGVSVSLLSVAPQPGATVSAAPPTIGHPGPVSFQSSQAPTPPVAPSFASHAQANDLG